jgi:hypothetical protein
MGIAELLVVLLILLPIGILISLRKYYPGRLWVGLTICAFIGGIGHFYIPGGLWYAIGLGVAFVFLKVMLNDAEMAMTIANIASVGIFYWRFKKGLRENAEYKL